MLIYNDSRLIVNQVNNTFEAKEEIMKKYLKEIKKEISIFEVFEIKYPMEETHMLIHLLVWPQK